MSDEDFLARWSRRKRAAETEKAEAEPRRSESPPPDVRPEVAPTSEQKPDEEFDPASLPPIDSIAAATDITAFLRKGVPAELTRAALRRAWTADPAIRDFVGLAENAWDFNDPSAMGGFGPLDRTPEQLRQMVSDLFGDAKQAADQLVNAVGDAGSAEPPQDSALLSPPATPADADESVRQPIEQSSDASLVAPRDEAPQVAASQQSDSQTTAQRPRRSHGRALPQ